MGKKGLDGHKKRVQPYILLAQEDKRINMRTTTLKLLEVTLKGLPPSVNQMYRNAGTRIRYKTEKTRDYQRYAIKAIQGARLVPYTFEGRTILNVKFFVADKRKWDMDNRLKALQDCLQMARIIKDDSQIDDIHVQREWLPSGNTRTCVSVFSILELPN